MGAVLGLAAAAPQCCYEVYTAWREGNALLAAENDRLIVPVAHDAGYYWPRRGLYKQPGTIRVVIGPPIVAAGRDARAVNEEAQQWIEAHSRH